MNEIDLDEKQTDLSAASGSLEAEIGSDVAALIRGPRGKFMEHCPRFQGRCWEIVRTFAEDIHRILTTEPQNLYVDYQDYPGRPLHYVQTRCRRKCGDGRSECPYRAKWGRYQFHYLTPEVVLVRNTHTARPRFVLMERLLDYLDEMQFAADARTLGYTTNDSQHDFVVGVVYDWLLNDLARQGKTVILEEACGNGWDLKLRVQQPGQPAERWGVEVKTGNNVMLVRTVQQIQDYRAQGAIDHVVVVLPWWRQPRYGGWPTDWTIVTFQQLRLPPRTLVDGRS